MKTQSKDTRKLVENLEKWRKEHNMSQSDFAKALGGTASTYSKVLSGEVTTIKADTIKRIYLVTGKLCFQLMEAVDDDYLRLLNKLQQLTPREIKYINKVVDVYLEAKKRSD